jgi:hypothetical protein
MKGACQNASLPQVLEKGDVQLLCFMNMMLICLINFSLPVAGNDCY